MHIHKLFELRYISIEIIISTQIISYSLRSFNKIFHFAYFGILERLIICIFKYLNIYSFIFFTT